MEQKQMKRDRSIYVGIGYLAGYVLFVLILPRVFLFPVWWQCIVYMVFGIAGMVIFRRDFKKGVCLWKTNFLRSTIWLVAAFFAQLLLSNLAVIPAYLLGTDDIGGNAEAIGAVLQMVPIPVVILALGVLGPVVEETIYRLLLVGSAAQKWPVVLCIAVSSLLFMLAHVKTFSVEGLAGVLPVFTTGLVYAFVYHKTKNITIPVILHIVNNSLSLLMA